MPVWTPPAALLQRAGPIPREENSMPADAAKAADSFDVIVVGGGNAAFCAALSAQEQGARVVVLERAPEEESGGNTRFTAGAIRFAYRGVEDLKEIMPDLTEAEIAQTDFGTYTEDQFFDDMFRVTRNRSEERRV